MVKHLLHLVSHVVRCSVLLLVSIQLARRHALAVLLVLQKVAAKHTVNVFEVLKDLEARTLVL